MRKLLYPAAIVLLAACEKADDWKPGPATPEGTPIVYFSSSNPTVVGHTGTNPASTFTLSLERADATGELTVPIVVLDSAGCMTIPQKVTFLDGEEWVDMPIDYVYQPGMHLSLTLGKGYGDPYAEQDGTMNYQCSIARLKPLCKVKYHEDSKLSQVESYIYNYEGINQFLFYNFLDSHVDVNFTVDTQHAGVTFDPDNLHALKGDFVPIDNCYQDGDGWWLYDDKNDDYPAWTPTGWDPDKPVLYFYYYGYYEEYDYSYAFIDFSNKSDSRFYASAFYFDEDMEDSASPDLKYKLDYKAVENLNE